MTTQEDKSVTATPTNDLGPSATLTIDPSALNYDKITIATSEAAKGIDLSALFFAPCAHPPYFASGEDDIDGDDLTEGWDQDTGRPGIGLFANAVQVWSIMQDRLVTVAEASQAFRVPEEAIRQALEWHTWMLLETHDGVECIGHDGE